MRIYGWDKNLETGIELIDEQHMQMLIAVNKLVISRKCKYNRDTLEYVIHFLENYVQYHFQAEEAFQVECQYEGFREHQARHDSLSTQLRFLIIKLDASDYADSEVDEFYAFLRDWVNQHMLQDDVHFAQAYRAYRGKQEAT